MKSMLLLFVIGLASAQGMLAQNTAPAADKPFMAEYYYKAKWGYADEFLQLFKKNHYPVLKKEIEMGRLLKVWVEQPRYHTTEDGRWDYRVTIVFKNAAVANEQFDESALQRQLFPDQDTFKKEEQRRFEILPLPRQDALHPKLDPGIVPDQIAQLRICILCNSSDRPGDDDGIFLMQILHTIAHSFPALAIRRAAIARLLRDLGIPRPNVGLK